MLIFEAMTSFAYAFSLWDHKGGVKVLVVGIATIDFDALTDDYEKSDVKDWAMLMNAWNRCFPSNELSTYLMEWRVSSCHDY